MIVTVSCGGIDIGVVSGVITGRRDAAAGGVAGSVPRSSEPARVAASAGRGGAASRGCFRRRRLGAAAGAAVVGVTAAARCAATVVGAVTVRRRGGDARAESRGCAAGVRSTRGNADTGDHGQAGHETRDRDDELAAQHLRVQRAGLVRRASEELDDARLDLLGVVTERARQRDEVVGAQRDRLTGLRAAHPLHEPTYVREHLVVIVGLERSTSVPTDDRGASSTSIGIGSRAAR